MEPVLQINVHFCIKNLEFLEEWKEFLVSEELVATSQVGKKPRQHIRRVVIDIVKQILSDQKLLEHFILLV